MKHTYSYHQNDGHDLGDWLRQLPENYEKQQDALYTGRNSLKVMRLPDGGRVVIKRFHRPNHMQRVYYTRHRNGKARRAYDNATELRRRGFDTPAPVAYVEENRLGIYLRSWYVYNADLGITLASLATLLQNESEERYYELLNQFAAFVASTHEAGIVNHDLNTRNVLCHTCGHAGKWTFGLIDTNRIRFAPSGEVPPMEQCIRTLMALPATPWFDFEYFAISYLMHRNMFCLTALDDILNRKAQYDRQFRRRKTVLHHIGRPYYRMLGAA